MKRYLTLSILGKNFSRQHFEMFFVFSSEMVCIDEQLFNAIKAYWAKNSSYFFLKTDFDISWKLSYMSKMSESFSWKK